MKVTAMGIDLAKNVFQVHGVDEQGKVVLRKQLRRSQMMVFFAQRTPCLVGMEACAGAHDWARRLINLGYTVKLMAPQFVKPYVKTNKNDAADAEAICEAVSRTNMRFCTGQDHRPAGGFGIASGAAWFRAAAHGAGESNSRAAVRIWRRDAPGDSQHP
jgi:transposase